MWLKLATFFYFLIFSFFANLFQLFIEPDVSLPVVALVLVRILIGFLDVFPILFFSRVGIFHLLVFPFYLRLAKKLAQNPFSLFAPFFGDGVVLQSTSLASLDDSTLLFLNLEGGAYTFIFTTFLFIGYIAIGNSYFPQLASTRKRTSINRFYALATFILLVVLVFFSLQGGVTGWISKWGTAGGRDQAGEDLGPVLRLLRSAYFLPLAWYLYQGGRVFRNFFFVPLLILTVFLGFAATGSRSSVVGAVIPFLVAYALRNRSLPIKRALAFGFVFFFLFGLLGQIRSASTFNRGNFSWEDIDFSIRENVDRASAESEQWASRGAGLALYYSVPERVDYLYGYTYLGALSFWIPRIIWKDKPHGGGYYNGRLIFEDNRGIPPGDVPEAYWNFGLFGVLLIGFLNGALIKLASQFLEANFQSIGAVVVYIMILKTGLTMSSLGLTGLFQSMIFVVLGLKYLRLL